MSEHDIAPLGEIHIPYNWAYANAAARTGATGLIAADVGKFARQLDDNSIWMLTDESPVTWVAVSGVSGGGGAGSVTVVHLGTNVTNPSATAAKITGLDTPLTAGTYKFEYWIRYQVAATSTGVKFSVNYTGTVTAYMSVLRYTTSATTSVSDIADQDVDLVNGSLYQAWARRAVSVTANMGPTAGTSDANADMLTIIEGLLVVSGSGNIELWHASDVAADSTVMIGTSLILTKSTP